MKMEAESKSRSPRKHMNKTGPVDNANRDFEIDQKVGYEKGDYVVEKILKRRWCIEQRVLQFQIKWKGWDYQSCTWEPLENINNLEEELEKFQTDNLETLIFQSTNSMQPIASYKQTIQNHRQYCEEADLTHFDQLLNSRMSEEPSQNLISENASSQSSGDESKDIDIDIEDDQKESSVNDEVQMEKCFSLHHYVYDSASHELKAFLKHETSSELKGYSIEEVMLLDPQIGIDLQKMELALIQKSIY